MWQWFGLAQKGRKIQKQNLANKIYFVDVICFAYESPSIVCVHDRGGRDQNPLLVVPPNYWNKTNSEFNHQLETNIHDKTTICDKTIELEIYITYTKSKGLNTTMQLQE